MEKSGPSVMTYFDRLVVTAALIKEHKVSNQMFPVTELFETMSADGVTRIFGVLAV